MAIQLSVEVRNARLDAIETAIDAANATGTPTLVIVSGAPPATTATAATGTVLATIALPADWMAAASNGSKAMSGTWSDSAADAAGTAGHFRIYSEAALTTAHMQGTITATGGGGDMELDNTVFAAGQAFSVTSFTINEANA